MTIIVANEVEFIRDTIADVEQKMAEQGLKIGLIKVSMAHSKEVMIFGKTPIEERSELCGHPAIFGCKADQTEFISETDLLKMSKGVIFPNDDPFTLRDLVDNLNQIPVGRSIARIELSKKHTSALGGDLRDHTDLNDLTYLAVVGAPRFVFGHPAKFNCDTERSLIVWNEITA